MNKLAERTSMRSLSRRTPTKSPAQSDLEPPSIERTGGLDCPVIRCRAPLRLRYFFPALYSAVDFFLIRYSFLFHSFPGSSQDGHIRVRTKNTTPPKITNSLTRTHEQAVIVTGSAVEAFGR